MDILERAIKRNTTGLIKTYDHYCILNIEGISYKFMAIVNSNKVYVLFKFKGTVYRELIDTANNREEFLKAVKGFVEVFVKGLNKTEVKPSFVKV